MRFKRMIAQVVALMWVSVSVRAADPYVYGYLTRTFDNGQTMCFLISDAGAKLAGSMEPEEWNYSGNLDIPEEVEWNGQMFTVIGIEKKALVECPELESVHIPATVKNIWADNFYGLPNLKSITVDPKCWYYSSIDGALYTKKGEVLLNYPPKAAIGEVKLPDSVRELGKWAFAYCTELKRFDFGSDIRTVGQYSFYKSGIEEIELPEGLKFTTSAGWQESYRTSTFSNCKNLRKVVFHPNGLEHIPAYAFQDSNVSEIVFPNYCDWFGEGAFSGNPFTEIVVPPSILGYVNSRESFGCGSAFINCRQLKTIALTSNYETFHIKGNDNLQTIYLPNGINYVYVHDIPLSLRDIYLARWGHRFLEFKTSERPTAEQKSQCKIHVEDKLEYYSQWWQIGAVVCDYPSASVEDNLNPGVFSDDEPCNVYDTTGNVIASGVPYGSIDTLGIKGLVIVRSLTTSKTEKMMKN